MKTMTRLQSVAETQPTAIVYARYSTELQRAASIEDQNRICTAEINRQGWRTVSMLSDAAITGSVDSRPGYQALLAAVQSRSCNIIIAEALDRLTRDQEDLAGLYKRCEFNDIRIFTLTEGWITALHVGLKGTMNSLQLKDLADKTRRGLHGRVLDGAPAGGLSYGYAVVAVPDGEDRGGRVIVESEAATVIRIFRDYADGLSPKAIAAALNREGIPGPRGGRWSQSTINGNRQRGTGVLNNELYVGYLVWNRLRYAKDPETGKRRSRLNDETDWVSKKVPHLRIIEASLWDAVRARQAALDDKATPARDRSTFQSKQRPRYLFSGLIHCARCGGGVSMIGATHLGCFNARNKGDAVCTNTRTMKRTKLEDEVLGALRTRLMAPEVYEAFVRGFVQEWNRDQGERAAAKDRQCDALKRADRQIANLVTAIAKTGTSPALSDALKKAEAKQAALRSELATAAAPMPRLLPNLAELYRVQVAGLQEALSGEDAAAAREHIRALVNEIQLVPSPTDPKAAHRIEVRGHLAAMLALGSGQSASAAMQVEKQIKLVAGAGFEPAAFRL